jgi:hypothetical protein
VEGWIVQSAFEFGLDKRIEPLLVKGTSPDCAIQKVMQKRSARLVETVWKTAAALLIGGGSAPGSRIWLDASSSAVRDKNIRAEIKKGNRQFLFGGCPQVVLTLR